MLPNDETLRIGYWRHRKLALATRSSEVDMQGLEYRQQNPDLNEGFESQARPVVFSDRRTRQRLRGFGSAVLTAANIQREQKVHQGQDTHGGHVRFGLGLMMVMAPWGCTAIPPCPPPDSVAVQSQSVNQPSATLQQKVKAQEKRISELSAQLNLLKRIDQDQQKQR
jgi:hypothetical protein